MAKKKKNIKNKGNDKKKMISNFPSKKEEKAVHVRYNGNNQIIIR